MSGAASSSQRRNGEPPVDTVDVEGRELHGTPPNKFAAGIAHIDAPGFVNGTIFNPKAGHPHRFRCGIQVIHPDRRSGTGVRERPSLAVPV
jgi:hypothetical protein